MSVGRDGQEGEELSSRPPYRISEWLAWPAGSPRERRAPIGGRGAIERGRGASAQGRVCQHHSALPSAGIRLKSLRRSIQTARWNDSLGNTRTCCLREDDNYSRRLIGFVASALTTSLCWARHTCVEFIAHAPLHRAIERLGSSIRYTQGHPSLTSRNLVVTLWSKLVLALNSLRLPSQHKPKDLPALRRLRQAVGGQSMIRPQRGYRP
jgi:hypothetical protein